MKNWLLKNILPLIFTLFLISFFSCKSDRTTFDFLSDHTTLNEIKKFESTLSEKYITNYRLKSQRSLTKPIVYERKYNDGFPLYVLYYANSKNDSVFQTIYSWNGLLGQLKTAEDSVKWVTEKKVVSADSLINQLKVIRNYLTDIFGKPDELKDDGLTQYQWIKGELLINLEYKKVNIHIPSLSERHVKLKEQQYTLEMILTWSN